MNTPEWLKPGIYGALIGGVFVGVVGFSWGGWMTGGSADKMANAMSRDSVIAALVPVCVDMARTDTQRAAYVAVFDDGTTSEVRRRHVPLGREPGSDDRLACDYVGKRQRVRTNLVVRGIGVEVR